PRAVAERFTERTANESAIGTRASPTPEETRPSQSSRNGRSLSGETVPPGSTAGKRNPYPPELLYRFRVGNGSCDGGSTVAAFPAPRRGRRGRAPVSKTFGGGAPLRAARPPLSLRRGGRHPGRLHPGSRRARARREGSRAAQLADQDRAQRVSPPRQLPQAARRAARAACRRAGGSRSGGRVEERARGAPRRAAAGARPARAGGAQLPRDRNDARPLGLRGRDA